MAITSSSVADRREEMAPVSLAEVILSAVRRCPETQIVYAGPQGERVTTYLDTYQESRHALANLRRHQVRAGDIVVLALEEPEEFIPALWACVLGGVTPCPIIPRVSDPALWNGHLEHLSRLFDAPAFVASARNRALFDGHRLVTVEDLRGPRPDPSATDSDAATAPAGRDLAFLMLSSGSTGAPKAIALTHENVLTSLEGKRLATAIDHSDVTMNWIAFDHVAALTECHLLPLATGSAQVHIAPADIVADPLFFVRAISRYQVTHTFTPNFLLGQIVATLESDPHARSQTDGLDLSSVRRIISGGEANVCETGARFLRALAGQGLAPSVLWPAFGMTETCAGSIYSTMFENEIGRYEFASLGRPVPGLELRIMTPEGAPAAPGMDGELQLRGPMVFQEYRANAEATAAAFTPDGWFRTGDLGRLDPDTGSLRLVGRSKDSIIVNGINYFLHELEAAVGDIEGILPSFVACFPTRPPGSDTESLVVLYTPGEDCAAPAQLRNTSIAIRNVTVLRWGFRPLPVLPVPKEVLARTSLGKIQRSALRARYEQGEFRELIARLEADEADLVPPLVPPRNAVERRTVELFARITGIPPERLGATSNFFSLGGTSLEILRLLASVNEAAAPGRTIALVDLVRDPTPHGIAALLSAATGPVPEYDPVVPLQEAGETVKVLVIDAPPVIEHPRGTVDRVESALMLAFFLDFIDREQLDDLDAVLRADENLDPADYLFSLAPAGRVRELGQTAATFKHWSELAYGLSELGAAYRPRATVEDITVFYAQPIWGDTAEYLSATLSKWDHHSPHPVRYVKVPGEHHTLLGPRFVDKFHEAFCAELARHGQRDR